MRTNKVGKEITKPLKWMIYKTSDSGWDQVQKSFYQYSKYLKIQVGPMGLFYSDAPGR